MTSVAQLFKAAGGGGLSPSSRAALKARLGRYPYLPAARNFGRLLCHVPQNIQPLNHHHGQRDKDGALRCILDKGYYVRRWPTPLEGMRRLVLLMGHDSRAELAGFRSLYPEGGGTIGHDGPAANVGAWYDFLAPKRLTPEEADSIGRRMLHPLGANEQSEHAFQLLLVDWQAFEAAGVGTSPAWAFLAPTHDAWVAFRDAWKGGDADTTALSAMAEDADRVRRELATKDPKWGDPNKGDTSRFAVPDVTQSTVALQAAQATSDAAAKMKAETFNVWASIPLKVKLAGGAGLALLAAIAVKR